MKVTGISLAKLREAQGATDSAVLSLSLVYPIQEKLGGGQAIHSIESRKNTCRCRNNEIVRI